MRCVAGSRGQIAHMQMSTCRFGLLFGARGRDRWEAKLPVARSVRTTLLAYLIL